MYKKFLNAVRAAGLQLVITHDLWFFFNLLILAPVFSQNVTMIFVEAVLTPQ